MPASYIPPLAAVPVERFGIWQAERQWFRGMDGRIHYTMANDMDLSSFAAGNVLGTEVYLPKEGQPFSGLRMVLH